MRKTIIFLIISFGVLLHPSKAEILKTNYSSRKMTSIKKWEVIDIAFKGKSKTPFVTDFYATFTSPSGKKQKAPGFYNGGNEWLLRFSGSETGTWSYITTSQVKSLNGKKGNITILDKTADGAKGGIVIPEKDMRHFYYEDGSPYFLMAFECDWLYALDYHNEEGLPKTNHLLNLLQQNGLNQVVMNVFSFDVSWKKDELLLKHPEHEFGGPKNIFPFLGDNKNPDYSSLNVDFFKKFDRTIDLMNQKGIISHLMIYVWNKLVAWPEMNSEADNMYFDYVVKRYGAFPNIMWDVSKEALFYGRADDKYILERIERLRNANYFKRLVTVHDYGFCKRHPESVDYISRQDWTYALYTNMLNDFNKYKDKPVFNIEHGGYEESPYVVFPGSYISAEQCLKRNYQCAFAGVYSTYYWQGTSWNAIIYNPFEQEDSFYKPKFEYFKHMTQLFTDYPFGAYNPVPWHNQAGYCLKHKDKEEYLNYVPKETYQYRKEYMFKDKKPVYFKWFNTLTGEYSQETKFDKKQEFISPWYGQADAILITWKL
ncbi:MULTISPECIES: apiosidase-like domain-containing protein [unclassified Saccharicrinis]|uniref:apiosidase-like domain-containing protein n=1 Tax=unclassified Saccharicrinis TaxID=2646859 RepID=UPI003D32D2EE